MPSKKIMYCCCCVTVFFILGLLAFILTRTKKEQKKEEFDESDTKVTVMLFKADWCGHCKNFIPEWTKFKNKYPSCEEYDADKNDDVNKKFGVNSYPTVLIKTNEHDEPIKYTGERTSDALEKYVNSLY